MGKLRHIFIVGVGVCILPFTFQKADAGQQYDQPIKNEVADSIFIKRYQSTSYQANTLHDPCDVLRPFINSLIALENGADSVVSIVHIGDSHIQAGYLGARFRYLMQHCYGNAGRGLIVPLKLARTNGIGDYTISSPNHWQSAKMTQQLAPDVTVGVSGYVVETSDNTITFDIRTFSQNAGQDCRFNRITVFHHSAAPLLCEEARFGVGFSCVPILENYTTQLVLNGLYDSVRIKGSVVDSCYATPAFFGFSLENGSPGVLYHGIGVNGVACEHYNRVESVITQTAALAPRLVVVSLGTNEAFGCNFNQVYFKEQLQQLMAQIRRANPAAAVLVTTPMESCRRRRVKRRATYVPNPKVQDAAEVIRANAGTLGYAYWDMYEVCGGDGSCARWSKEQLMQRDHVHPTQEGYSLQGELLFHAIKQVVDRR